MVIQLTKSRTVHDVQSDFNKAYLFLRLQFYGRAKKGYDAVKNLPLSGLLSNAGLLRDGELMIADYMTVAQLENTLSNSFGLNVQVARRSGSVWLETTLTDNWSLFQQNEHGRELSLPVRISPIEDDQYREPD